MVTHVVVAGERCQQECEPDEDPLRKLFRLVNEWAEKVIAEAREHEPWHYYSEGADPT